MKFSSPPTRSSMHFYNKNFVEEKNIQLFNGNNFPAFPQPNNIGANRRKSLNN